MVLNEYQSKLMNDHVINDEIDNILSKASTASDIEDALVIGFFSNSFRKK